MKVVDNNWHLPGTPLDEPWTVDWSGMTEQFPFVEALRDCPQSPEFHAEGDVLVHTGMVCDALVADPNWRALSPDARAIVFASAVLHDVAKPRRTRIDELTGNIVSPGHSVTGAYMTREILYRGLKGVLQPPPPPVREQIAMLVRWHGLPLNWDRRATAEKDTLALSLTVAPRWLAILARADVQGRICPDKEGLLERIDLFEAWCDELGCLDKPKAFANDFTRFAYFKREAIGPEAILHDDTTFEVTMLSGLPGAGKDNWVKQHGGELPVVSLDSIRVRLGIRGDKPQGPVVAAAREEARGHLRRSEPFIWNATNISSTMREPLVSLFAKYRARVRIVYVEVPHATLTRQNDQRADVVPSKVIGRLLGKWSPPTTAEAHDVEWHIR